MVFTGWTLTWTLPLVGSSNIADDSIFAKRPKKKKMCAVKCVDKVTMRPTTAECRSIAIYF